MDTWMILPGNFQYLPGEGNKTEKNGIWGYRAGVTPYSGGTYDEVVFNPLAGKNDIADIKKHSWPAPDILDYAHYPAEAGAHADRAIIGVFTYGAFFVATFVRGLEDLMMDFALRRDYADCLIKTITDIIVAAPIENILAMYDTAAMLNVKAGG